MLVIAYSSQIAHSLGRRDWADKHLWGTMQWYILIGVGIIFISIIVMFGGAKSASDGIGELQMQNESAIQK